MTAQRPRRQSHACFDTKSRSRKAEKIRLLLDDVDWHGARVLDIGTGSGHIAAYFGELTGGGGEVVSIDVRDERRVHSGYTFRVVEGAQLPFPTGTFDIVLSNHVIEHVGDRADQARHVGEIERVLRSDGSAYVATPSRWWILEPHFRLPFLSWLGSTRVQSGYVRLARRGNVYDCRLLSRRDVEGLFEHAGLAWRDLTARAVRAYAETEVDSRLGPVLRRAPQAWVAAAARLGPTLVYRVSPERLEGGADDGVGRDINTPLGSEL